MKAGTSLARSLGFASFTLKMGTALAGPADKLVPLCQQSNFAMGTRFVRGTDMACKFNGLLP